MNKIDFIKNPKLYQGQTKKKISNEYFEGWYFKNIFDNYGISFIPGINIENGNKYAFIQVITESKSYYLKYNFKDFIYSNNPFYIKIGNNKFSDKELILDISDKLQAIEIKGKLIYSDNKLINSKFLSPNIMGPFSYLSFMECNHAIISMKNTITGNLKINGIELKINNGIGYIEKDWGVSFPKSYIWYQANNFSNNTTTICFSVANIPFKVFNFKGFICVLIIDGKEYRFTSYNKSKLVSFEILENYINIKFKKDKYTLEVLCERNNSFQLMAPKNGKMSKKIYETISATSIIKLYEKELLIYVDKSINCGLEIVN